MSSSCWTEHLVQMVCLKKVKTLTCFCSVYRLYVHVFANVHMCLFHTLMIPKSHMKCRWFGLGFLFYWCIGTPLLFKSYRLANARGFWHYTATQHNLWASYYLCLVRLTYYCAANTTCNSLPVLVVCHHHLACFDMDTSSLFGLAVEQGVCKRQCCACVLPRLECAPALLLALCFDCY